MGPTTRKTSGPLLVIVPSLNTSVGEDGRARLTRKFVEGMGLTSRLWPGPVATAMFSETPGSTGNLDDEWYRQEELPFELRIIGGTHPDIFSAVQDARVAQFGGDHRLRKLPAYCSERKIHCVFVSEYTLRTRFQIISSEIANPAIRLRRAIWAWGQELHNRRAVRAASAVQCNGTPTFDAYAKLNANTMLYFDSRIDDEMISDCPALTDRSRSWDGVEPIRLAFSGRLNRMKGADDLVEVARVLKKSEFPFRMDIFGDGPIAPEMNKLVKRYGLEKNVSMKGVVDFASELVPYVRSHVDLFVCCHRQGDPSCTYIETFACGVPIVGYGNEALRGIIRREEVGWVTPMNDPVALAHKIMALYASPSALIDAGSRAIEFAKEHTAEREFRSRINHMLKVAAP